MRLPRAFGHPCVDSEYASASPSAADETRRTGTRVEDVGEVDVAVDNEVTFVAHHILAQ